MQYIQITFSFIQAADYQKDLLMDDLAQIGYNTFEDTENGFAAFIDFDQYSELSLKQVVSSYEPELKSVYTIQEIDGANWNEEWEKNFEPLIINDQCYVRATFHEARPEYPYEIVIDPKMAFGTGHHQTTTMMMQYILESDLKDQKVLDMGCGTGILAILAAKRGAAELVAIDYDDVCYSSVLENTLLNNIPNISSYCGSKEAIPTLTFDTILANINRNILLDQIEDYSRVLKSGGAIYFSGFYEHPDLDMIKAECLKFDIHYLDHKKIDEWVAAKFVKR